MINQINNKFDSKTTSTNETERAYLATRAIPNSAAQQWREASYHNHSVDCEVRPKRMYIYGEEERGSHGCLTMFTGA